MRVRGWVVAALVVALAACGADDDAVDVGAGDGAATTETTDQTKATETTGTPDTTETADTTDDVPAVGRPLEVRPVLEPLFPHLVAERSDVPEGCRTPEADWALDVEVFAPELQAGEVVRCLRLAPTTLTDDIVADAQVVQLEPGVSWQIAVVVRDDRIDEFNAVAGACFEQAASCPTGMLALVSDGDVLSAPSINAPSFEADQISISGDWERDEAERLAARIR